MQTRTARLIICTAIWLAARFGGQQPPLARVDGRGIVYIAAGRFEPDNSGVMRN